MRIKTISLLLFFTLAGLFSCNRQKQTGQNQNNELIIFHAGSLALPFKHIIEEFNKSYPQIQVTTEIAGSVACARKITDLNKECDIMASADYKVIEQMLIPKHAAWNIKFATNEMSIAYTENSRFADEFSQDNWYKILLNDEVVFGRSDPNSDPCGYRSVITAKLAEKYYQKSGLADSLLSKNTEYIRPKEVDLLALLETQTLDYIFIYRSVAGQHGLKYLLLPDSINLKKTALSDFYRTASVEINGKKPGEKITQYGEPMVYGVTLLNSAPNRENGLLFLQFLLSRDKGQKIMEQNGQPSIVPAPAKNYEKIPSQLQEFAKPVEH